MSLWEQNYLATNETEFQFKNNEGCCKYHPMVDISTRSSLISSQKMQEFIRVLILLMPVVSHNDVHFPTALLLERKLHPVGIPML